MVERRSIKTPRAQEKKSDAGPGDGAAGAPAADPAALCRDYDTQALVLQGGGALGAYQCGVYEAMHEARLQPDWFVGTSIGAINAAILAGNAPDRRLERLHDFWDTICEPVGVAPLADAIDTMLAWLPQNSWLSAWANSLGALGALTSGQQGFFQLRSESPFLYCDGSPRATSFYDTSPLKSTLERLVDFDRINAGKGVRLTVGAAEVETGNSRYFDSRHETIRAEHVMASGALPPAFPAIEIDGRHYWDGGVLSNTPLERVWRDVPRHDTLVLQVDLWRAHGHQPQDMMEVFERQKDIQYSSRTRRGTDSGAQVQRLRHAIHEVLTKVPEEYISESVRRELAPWAGTHVYNIVHLIYQSKSQEAQYKDYAFGLLTQQEHWASGRVDMQRTLAHPEFFVKPSCEQGAVTHDVHRLVSAHAQRKAGAAGSADD